jgi:hypothetical protein
MIVGFFYAVSVSSACAQNAFFPLRPAHVPPLHYISGTIVSYGAGNDTAGLAIRGSSGKLVQFFLASPSRINAMSYDVTKCSDRGCGTTLIFGRTKVRVEYWMQRAPWGESVKVSNSIVTLH